MCCRRAQGGGAGLSIAADLRRIAGEITALTELPAAARGCVSQLDAALAQDDPAALVRP